MHSALGRTTCCFAILCILGALGCRSEPSEFHLSVFNGHDTPLQDCVIRFPMVIQPIGTVEPKTGRIHHDLRMAAPGSMTIEWTEDGSGRSTVSLPIPPLPPNRRSDITIGLARGESGDFTVVWK